MILSLVLKLGAEVIETPLGRMKRVEEILARYLRACPCGASSTFFIHW